MEQYTEWNGFRCLHFTFEDKGAVLVFPHSARADKKWLLKTEYFGAFPNFEIKMLENGYHLAHVDNTSRWCLDEDTERQARFCAFLREKYGLAEKCMPVGMSCGGMQAVYLAGKHPDKVAALYLDAPVLNLLSCPLGLGMFVDDKEQFTKEFLASGRMTISEALNYREHPIDFVPMLLRADIPVMLVCGDSDLSVPYPENGAVLKRMYEVGGGRLTHILKPGCGHHPHGLEDPAPILDFAAVYYGD